MSVKTIFLSKQSTVNGKKAYATGDVALNLKKYTIAVMDETGITYDTENDILTLAVGNTSIFQMKIVGSQNRVTLKVPTYANNTAALDGGLTANMIYKTSTGELRIVV